MGAVDNTAFFALIGEGAGLLKSLNEDAPGFFDSLNRLREILAAIGEPAGLSFSLSDKEGSVASLKAYLQSPEFAALPDPFKMHEADTVALLGQAVGDYKVVEGAFKMHGNQAVYDVLASRAVAHGVDAEKLNNNIKDANAILAQVVTENPSYIASRAKYDAVSAERFAKIKEWQEKEKSGQLEPNWRELLDQYDEAQINAWNEAIATERAFQKNRTDGYLAAFKDDGETILSAIRAKSPITTEQAKSWADQQVIDDNAKAKLKRLGYKVEDVYRDMADFYQLTGGKCSAIRIQIGGKRANAVGVTTRLDEKVINLGQRFSKTVLFHEMAHFLENDPIAQAGANGFLLKRKEGDKVYRLRDLTGNTNYGRDEVAYKDGFMDAYVGKVYSDGVTEVFSMGLQYLATPKDAAMFAAKDPEHYALVTGYISQPLTPAMNAKLNMHGGAMEQKKDERQKEQDAEAEKEALLSKAIKKLSGEITLTDQIDFDPDAPAYNSESSVERAVNDGLYGAFYTRPKKFIGRYGDFFVYEGQARNPQTKRNSKGFAVIKPVESDRAFSSSYDAAVVHGGLDVAKAVIALCEKNNTNPYMIYHNYFLTSSWAKKDARESIIQQAGLA